MSSSSTTSTEAAAATFTRHTDWYLIDGNIVISVSNTLFRLHRSVLQMHSVLLQDMMALHARGPTANDTEGEGVSDQHPMALSVIDKPDDLAMLLSIMYGRSRISKVVKNASALVALLITADKLLVRSIFRDSVTEAQKRLPPLARLGLGLRLGITALLKGHAKRPDNTTSDDSDEEDEIQQPGFNRSAIHEVVLDYSIDSRFTDESGYLQDFHRVRLQRARTEISHKRMQSLATKITEKKSTRLGDPISLAVILSVVPTTSRDKLQAAARDKAASLASGSSLNSNSYSLVQAEMETWIASDEEECAVIDAIWKSFNAVV
ncbi:hypothetical protein BKA62DRAFT_772876 [Auriculariales sp. MPI-PUGE-AT-0066]|nr:hypothetical protein BKA62DRAFT_772876 [Auriculariales sp. MPI-PUGE-AT-0066]